MPKIIKKKTKPVKKEEPEFKDVVSRARKFRQWRMEYRIAAVAIPLILVAVAAVYIYTGSAGKRADKFQYEGYKLYHSINLIQPIPDSTRYEQALDNFKKAYSAKQSAFSLFYIASSLESMGRHDEALSALSELNKKFPDNLRFAPLAFYKMAMISLKKGNPGEALKHLETLYNYKTASFKDLSLMESARILDATGKADEARKKYEALLSGFADSPFFEEAEAALKARG